jgi:hypothetical protein
MERAETKNGKALQKENPMKHQAGSIFLRFVLAAGLLAGAAQFPFAQDSLNYQTQVAAGNGQVRWSNCQFAPDGTLYVVYGNSGFTPWAAVSMDNPIWMVSYDGTSASTPFNVTDTATVDAYQPNIAINKSGLMAVVWGQQQSDSIYLRTYDTVAKTWGSIETVATGYGNYEPAVVIDSQGNIFMAWFTALSGGVYTRAKVNGVWEDIFRQPAVGLTKQQQIAIGPDDVVHLVWIDKNYGTFTGKYSKRSRSFAWTAPEEWVILVEPTHPSITITPDNVPWVASQEAVDPLEHFSEIWIMNLTAPAQRSKIGQDISQHYPRIQADSNGNLHVAIQDGGNDIGIGVLYGNNIDGNFGNLQYLPGTKAMQEGIHSDGQGNTAVCWTSLTSGTTSKIYIASLKPISPTEPPVDLGMTISTNGVLKGTTTTYNLSWAKNPLNKDENLSGYKIYGQDSGGVWVPYASVPATSLSTSIQISSRFHKMEFAIVAVSKSGFESARAEF